MVMIETEVDLECDLMRKVFKVQESIIFMKIEEKER